MFTSWLTRFSSYLKLWTQWLCIKINTITSSVLVKLINIMTSCAPGTTWSWLQVQYPLNLAIQCHIDELSIFPSPDFAFHLQVNNNSTTSEALSRLPENHYRFCIHSNIIGSLSTLCYSLLLSDILPFKNNQDFICNTTSKSGNIGNAEYRD